MYLVVVSGIIIVSLFSAGNGLEYSFIVSLVIPKISLYIGRGVKVPLIMIVLYDFSVISDESKLGSRQR